MFTWILDWILRRRVFISYSDEDQPIVHPVVRLLRIARGPVFFAPDSIGLGDKWWETIQQAIRKCKLLVVFWCSHSAASTYVQQEFTYADRLGKPIVPVFLDDTQIPTLLSQYEGIDFRKFNSHIDTRQLKPTAPGPVLDLEARMPTISADRYWNSSATRGKFWAAIVIQIGIVIVIIAVLRPFPALIKSELITLLNLATLFFGLSAIVYGVWLRRMIRRPVIQAAEAEKDLAQRLDLLLKLLERQDIRQQIGVRKDA